MHPKEKTTNNTEVIDKLLKLINVLIKINIVGFYIIHIIIIVIHISYKKITKTLVLQVSTHDHLLFNHIKYVFLHLISQKNY